MKISLVSLNSDDDIAYYVKPYYGCENVGIHLLAAVLRNEGHKVQIIDCTALLLTKSEALSKISSFKPDIVGFSPTIRSINGTMQICSKVKKWKSAPFVVLGGHHASLCAEDIISSNKNIDMVFYCEAEKSLIDLVNKLQKKDNLSNIEGTVVRTTCGVKRNPIGNSLPSIDSIPLMARDSLIEMRKRSPFVSACISSSRGCPYNCSFCSTPIFYKELKRYRKRSPINVVDEIELILTKYDVHLFTFCDDNFIIPSNIFILWAQHFADEMIKRQLPVVFSIMLRAEFFKSKFIELIIKLKEAGLHQVLIGFESATESTLDKYNKKNNIDDYYTAVKVLEENSIFLAPAFINLNPYLNPTDFIKNINFLTFIVKHPLLFHYVTRINAFPGTTFVKKLEFDGLIINNESNCINELQYYWRDPVINTFNDGISKISGHPYLSDELFDETHHLLSYIRGIRKISNQTHEEIFRKIKKLHKETAKRHYSILIKCLDAAADGDSNKIEQILYAYYNEKKHYRSISNIRDVLLKMVDK